MLIIYVDADACPVKEEVYRVARRYAMRVVIVANAPLKAPADALFELVVRPGFGTADDYIAETIEPGDVAITADIPLAARCLSNGGRVLDPRGRVFYGQRHWRSSWDARLDERTSPEWERDGRATSDEAEGPFAVCLQT